MIKMENTIKTDRLKLSGTSNSPEEAENIFRDIQEKTGVKLQWELNKFSSTFKRDPVIRLCGTPEAVKSAREMILQNLEIQSNRVVLKMDITHEEHPSLIGKKGSLIKKVMETTNCHIHFPDVNIASSASNEKSNLVSITGEPSNVEKARIMLRALLPFQVIFEVDRSIFHYVNTTSPFWKTLEQKLGLSVHFIHSLNLISAVIRCSQGHFRALRQYILKFIELLSGKRESELPPVKVVMDIMPQHQNFVKGLRGSNIQAIAKRTGSKIVFPNLNSEASERRTVNITGHLDCVYMAWQEIMSSLPICVVFDVGENRDTKSDYTDFLTDCNITVFSRPKPRYHIKCMTVKGPEKFSKHTLQYRQRILNLPSIRFLPDVEHINKALAFQYNLTEAQQSQILENLSLFSSISLSSSQLENLTSVLNGTNSASSIENHLMKGYIAYNPSLYPSVNGCADVAFCKTNYKSNEGERHYSPMKSSPTNAQMYYTSSSPHNQNPGHSFTFGKWEETNNNHKEAVMKETHYLEGNVSPYRNSTSSDDLIGSIDSQTFRSKDKISTTVNQHEMFEKKLCAHQAIRRNIESTQVPSGVWAGYGFSQSMPAITIPKDSETSSQYSSASLESCSSEETWDNIVLADYIDDKIWSNKEGNFFSKSNMFEFKRHTSVPMNFVSEGILPRLLYEEGLYSYLDIFLKEEIDYSTFLLLNDDDLSKLGISYPGRMKISCLIRELQDAEMKAKTFDAAPGAERRLAELKI